MSFATSVPWRRTSVWGALSLFQTYIGITRPPARPPATNFFAPGL